MKKAILCSMLAAAGWISGGCITHDQTVVRDVERIKVQFESDTAARIFYEALSRAPARDSHSESTTKLEIPVLFEHTRHVVSGSNAAFNRAVEICDSNRDGKITEMEAKIYAEQAGK